MSKFKVGDKVVRKEDCVGDGLVDGFFLSKLGRDVYYTVTSVILSGEYLQVDGVVLPNNKHPWCACNFDLYQEPEDELPRAPTSVSYIKDDGRLKLEAYNTGSSVTLLLSLRKVSTLGYSLEPDAALQLAHDLRRMAMAVKHKGKTQ